MAEPVLSLRTHAKCADAGALNLFWAEWVLLPVVVNAFFKVLWHRALTTLAGREAKAPHPGYLKHLFSSIGRDFGDQRVQVILHYLITLHKGFVAAYGVKILTATAKQQISAI